MVCQFASHLDDAHDLAQLEAAYVVPLPGLYAALAGGHFARALQPVLPSVRALRARNPGVLARELPPHLPEWDLRFLFHVGIPRVALKQLGFWRAETMLQQLQPLGVLAGGPLLKQLESCCDLLFEELLLRIDNCIALSNCCLDRGEPIKKDILDGIVWRVPLTVLRIGEANLRCCLEDTDVLAGAVAGRHAGQFSADEEAMVRKAANRMFFMLEDYRAAVLTKIARDAVPTVVDDEQRAFAPMRSGR